MSAPSMPITSATSLVTLTTTANWFVPPAWTLAFEIYFYAGVVLILIIAPRFLFLAILLWMLVEASLGNLLPSWIHTHALVIEFGFGCLIAYLVNCRIRIAPMVSFLAACAAFFAGVMLSVQFGQIGGWLRVSTFGLGSAFLINAVIAAEQGGFIFPRVLQYLGDASYSLYVWHWLLLRALIGISERSGLIELVSPSSRPVFPVLWIAAALALAVAAHEYLERPMLQFLRRSRFHPSRLIAMSTETVRRG
jgi:peptidoglycan/LPS O-acetylase OafA/YrhL